MHHLLTTNTLYVLSGPSGSGKSYFTEQLLKKGQITQDCIINPDTIRLNMVGQTPKFDSNGDYFHINGWTIGNKEAFDISLISLELRLKNQMLTIFDATSLNDKARKDLFLLAKKHNIDFKVVIFDIEKDWVINNLKTRKYRFDASVVESQMLKFDRKSVYPYILFNPKIDKVTIVPNLITTEKLDIIGDTHGFKNNTIKLLNQFGWTVDSNNELTHRDKDRKILFLGDIIDRGPDGEELLDIIEKAVSWKKAYFLIGNHEKKLLNMLDSYYNNESVEKKSISVTLFFQKFIKLNEKKQKRFYKFLKESPVNYSLWIDKKTGLAVTKEDFLHDINEDNIQKFGFAHADISNYNDYCNVPSFLIYGSSNSSYSNDYQYENLYQKNINKHIYIHGHQPLKNIDKEVDEKNTKYDGVYSLDDKCAYNGNIKMMNFEQLNHLLKQNNYKSKHDFFEKSTKYQKVDFNFNDYLKSIDVEKEIDLTEINKSKEKNEQKIQYRK